ncbi:MAG: DUF2271 domain-containing protein [Ilumatobacteraceae bacterium]
MSFPLPRFEAVSRRQFIQRSLLVGAVALVPGVACSGEDDRSVLGGSGTTSKGTAGGADTTVAASSDQASTTLAAPSGPSFPAAGQLQVGFTYTAADGGGRVRNPYIAVWVETTDGELVQNLSLWYKSRDAKYLDHLKRWYNAESALLNAGGPDNIATVSGATKAPGSYQVSWDGTDVNGAVVAQGEYVLCIEAAREHGPYQLVSGPITIGGEAFTAALDDNGELTGVSAALVV